MPVHNANLLIKEARIKAELTQEQLSEGICTPQALSRIETGTANVSHVTFQALMKRAGVQYGRFPVFSSRDGLPVRTSPGKSPSPVPVGDSTAGASSRLATKACVRIFFIPFFHFIPISIFSFVILFYSTHYAIRHFLP